MVGQKQRVIVGHVRFDGGTELGGARCGVAHQRNLAQTDDHFGKKSLIESAVGDSESGGSGRMGMAHGVDVLAEAVDEKMHGHLGGHFAFSSELPAVQVGDHKIFWRKHPFVHASGRSQNAAAGKAD